MKVKDQLQGQMSLKVTHLQLNTLSTIHSLRITSLMTELLERF